MIENYIIITLIAWFVVYVVFIWGRYGIIKSISKSYKKLEDTKKSLGILFTIFCFVMGFLLMALVPIMGKFMAVSAMGALFTGAASRTEQKMTKTVHLVASGLLIAGAHLAIICTFNVWYPIGIAIMSGLVFLTEKIKHPIWWFELAQFIIVFTTLTICLNL
jgi:uncharacterized membrane protein (DUF485 family)